MKKLVSILMILALIFSLAACTAQNAQDAIDILSILLEETDYTPENQPEQMTPQTIPDPLPQGTEQGDIPPQTDEIQAPDCAEETAPVSIETEGVPTETEAEEQSPVVSETENEELPETPPELLDEHGTYSTKDEVALYVLQYGHLPENYITKKAAEKLGWSGGSLEPYAPGKCIGGSRFGNYEGLLPAKEGRYYTECDINTLGARSRGAERIVYSNDGLIFYTGDHYETFELLYGEVE